MQIKLTLADKRKNINQINKTDKNLARLTKNNEGRYKFQISEMKYGTSLLFLWILKGY